MTAADLPTVTLAPGQTMRVVGPKPLKVNYDKARSYYQITAPGTYVPPVVPPPPPPPTGKTVQAPNASVLMSALGDDAVSEIVLANGIQKISGAANQDANSLWVDKRFVGRTRPVIIRPATPGGVTLDAGGGYMGGLSFNDGGGALQTWQDFIFANGVTSQTGVIVFGGYPGLKAPHDLAIKRITIAASCHRVGDGTTDHAVYFSYALDGWGAILIEDLTVLATDAKGLATAVHMDHGYATDAPNVAAHGVTVRRLVFRGNPGSPNQQAIILWEPPVHDWLFDGADIQDAGGLAVRFESIGAKNIVFNDIVSRNSHGFYSSLGPNPPGVTFTGCTLA